MTKSALIAVLAFLLPVTALAKPSKAAEDSSAENRVGKRYSVVAQPIGFSVMPVPSYGLSLGYYLSPNDLIEYDYATGTASLFFFELFSTSHTLRYKHFFGNSFYTNVGLGTREIGGRTTIGALLGAPEIDYTESVTSGVVDLAIGNRWQFDTFTIGCDWIGASVPISTLSKKDTFPANASAADEEERKKREEDLNSLAVTGTMQLLRFYIGVSF